MTIMCTWLEQLDSYTFIDVRSPKEFNHSHIPGSINIPVLDNIERETIGLLFNKEGRSKAVNKGFEFLVEKFDSFCDDILSQQSKDIIVTCARGGLRSGIVVDLFSDTQKILNIAEESGTVLSEEFVEKLNRIKPLNIKKLSGGYKQYRNNVLRKLEKFDYDVEFIVLYGLTGVGKTDILKQLESEGFPVLDLEGCAQHRSSLFGSVGLQPHSQKMFESLLVEKLDHFKKNNIKKVFIEGEARKVGFRIIPEKLFKRMKQGMKVFIEGDINHRVERTVKEYFDTNEKTNQITQIIPKLKEVLGNERIEELLQLMENKEFEKVTKILLEEYYDKRYYVKDMTFSTVVNHRDREKLKLLLQ